MVYNQKDSMALMNQNEIAKYQIKRAIAQLKEAPGYKHSLNIPTVNTIKAVIAQLQAFLDDNTS